jgi:hypothetical protein
MLFKSIKQAVRGKFTSLSSAKSQSAPPARHLDRNQNHQKSPNSIEVGDSDDVTRVEHFENDFLQNNDFALGALADSADCPISW